MMLRRHKGKLTASAAVFLTVVFVLWSISSSPPPVRLTFLYPTNHPQQCIVGVFQLINELDESVRSSGGHFRPAKRDDLEPQIGDWGANLSGMKHFAARTTNVFEVWSPTNGGPYKLILYCAPASKTTPKFYRSACVRVASFHSQWVRPSLAIQGRWYGSIFAESQSLKSLDNPVTPNALQRL